MSSLGALLMTLVSYEKPTCYVRGKRAMYEPNETS